MKPTYEQLAEAVRISSTMIGNLARVVPPSLPNVVQDAKKAADGLAQIAKLASIPNINAPSSTKVQ